MFDDDWAYYMPASIDNPKIRKNAVKVSWTDENIATLREFAEIITSKPNPHDYWLYIDIPSQELCIYDNTKEYPSDLWDDYFECATEAFIYIDLYTKVDMTADEFMAWAME